MFSDPPETRGHSHRGDHKSPVPRKNVSQGQKEFPAFGAILPSIIHFDTEIITAGSFNKVAFGTISIFIRLF